MSSFLLKNGQRGAEFSTPWLAGSCLGRLGVPVVSKMRIIHEVVHRFRNSSLILSPMKTRDGSLQLMRVFLTSF